MAPKLQSYILLNMCQPRQNLTQSVIELIPSLEMNVLDSMICQRVAYKETAGVGETALASGDKKAHHEINELGAEVLNKLNNK
jgi:cellulose biosynthesis protein BcsQ